MKKFFSLVLALVMALSLTTVAWGAANSFYVDAAADPSIADGSEAKPFATVADAVAAAATGDTIYVAAGTYDKLATISGKTVTIDCEDGVVFTGASSLNINGSTVDGATFSNPSGNVVSGSINGIIKNCTFTGYNALRGCYAGTTVEFYNCVFDGDLYGVHFDGGANDVYFEKCTFSGFNAFGKALTNLTFKECTFKANDSSSYNGVNLWGDTVMEGCEFVFDGEAGTEWVDMCSANQTLKVTDSVVTDGAGGEKTLDTVIGREVSAKNGDTFYSTLQDAIDEGGTVILMADAGEIEVDEGVTIVPNGYDVTVKAADGSDVILNTDGEFVVVPAVTFGDKFDLYQADAGMNAALKAKTPDVAGLSFDEFDAKTNKDGSGRVAYIAANNGQYFVKTNNPTIVDYAVTDAGKNTVLYYVTVAGTSAANFEYEEAVSTFTNFGVKCDQVNITPVAGETYFKAADGDVYMADDAGASVNYLLNGKVVSGVYAGTPEEHTFVINNYKYDATLKQNIPTSAVCTKCLMNTGSIYLRTKVPATYTLYTTTGEGSVNYTVALPSAAAVVPSTPSTDKVESAETFDAGIAMYVGMSVMAAAGSAVVLKKRED